MEADEITLKLFYNRRGFYIYASNLFVKDKLIGSYAHGPHVDGLIGHIDELLSERDAAGNLVASEPSQTERSEAESEQEMERRLRG
jgi:hypothetical protein